MKVALGLLGAGILGLIWNFWLGWNLAQTPMDNADSHLVTGLFSLILISAASLLGIWTNEKKFEQIQKKGDQNDRALNQLLQEKQQTMMMSLGALGLSVIAIITGTISHSGKFPVIHFVLAIALLVLSLLVFWRWLKTSF